MRPTSTSVSEAHSSKIIWYLCRTQVLEALHYSPGREDEYRTAKITWRLVGSSSSPPPELHFLTSSNWFGQLSDVGSDCGPQECYEKTNVIFPLPAISRVSSAASKDQEGLYKTSVSSLKNGKKNITKTGTSKLSLKRKHSASECDFLLFQPSTSFSSAQFHLHSDGNLGVPAPHGSSRCGDDISFYNAKELLDLEVVQSILRGGRRYSTVRWSPADDEMNTAKCQWSFSGGQLLKSSYSEIRNFKYEANYVSRKGPSCKKEHLPRQQELNEICTSEVKPLFGEQLILSSTLQSDSDSEETSGASGDGDASYSGRQRVSGLEQEQGCGTEAWVRPGSVEGQCGSTRHCHDLTKYKTELCRSYQYNSHCGYGDACLYAHGTLDLRLYPRHPMYRTKQCFSFHHKGYCLYGTRCQFAHDMD